MAQDNTTIRESEIADFDPDTATIHTCGRCGKHLPIPDDYRGTPTCLWCAGEMAPDEGAHRYAATYGYRHPVTGEVQK